MLPSGNLVKLVRRAVFIVPFALCPCLSRAEGDVDFTVIDSFFTQISQVSQDINADKDAFNTLALSCKGAIDILLAAEAQRDSAFKCITDAFNKLVADYNACESKQQEVSTYNQQTLAAINASINDLVISTSKEMGGIQETIATLDGQINKLTADIGTLVSANTDNVQKALADLEGARSVYTIMNTSRSLFLAQLQDLLDKVNNYPLLGRSELAGIAQLICQQ